MDRAAPKEEERKLVTVLFADLTGSTALGEQLDPERLRVLLRKYFSEMAAVVERWGGTVEKFIGDAVMSVFGIPQLHEDDAERALRAALDMQASIERMNPDILQRHGVWLAMRVGVNTGEVIAGTGGDQMMVTGDVVNVAARLQQTANPGAVVAGERTYLSARGAFVFEELDRLELKGKSAGVRAWRLVEPAAAVRRRGVPGLAVRIVGRERELSLLESLYSAVVDEARPRLATVLGEAGVGKTRLTEEFLDRALTGPHPPEIHRGRCLPYGQGITYWALREMLWGAAGILLVDGNAVASEKLHKLVEGAFADAQPEEVDRVAFALATTAGITLPGNPLDDMSPESIGEELGLAWPWFVSALAADRPLVLLIEDLHWAEPPILDMMERLVARSSGPILIVATARNEFSDVRPGWSGHAGMSQIGLEPLTPAQARELVAELLPSAGDELRESVLAGAEGNPFFAEEIVRHLIDRGVLERRGEELVQARAEAGVDIPDTVRALLATRIDALPQEEKRTLQNAAVVGRIFWAAALERMRPDAPVRASLRALEDRGLVVTRPRSALPGQVELAFNHGLTREVAYESIPRARRAVAHAELARWIEELAGDRRKEFVELIAHHYESAARPEDADLAWPDDPERRDEVRTRAVAALLEAGEAAKTKYAIDQAIGFGDRALALAVTDAERLAALKLKAEAAHAGVRVEEGWRYYAEALELATKIEDRQAVSRLRAYATLLWSRYGGAFTGEEWRKQAVEIFTQGLEEAGEDSETFETGALLIGRSEFGWWFQPEGSESRLQDIRRDAERALEIAERIRSPSLLSHALDALSSLVRGEGFCESAAIAERMVRFSHSMADRVEAHELLVEAARSFSDAGRYDTALEVAEEAVRQAAQLSSHHRIHAARAKAVCLHPMGRLRDLLEATSEVPDLVREEGGHPCGMGIKALSAYALSLFEVRNERATDALDLLDAATPSIRALERFDTAETLRTLIGLKESRDWFERGRAHEAVQTDVATSVRRLRVELPLRALSGERDRLREAATEARSLSELACAPYLGSIADWAEAVQLAEDGRSEEALNRATVALSSLEAQGERYTGTRLWVDLLPFLDAGDAASAASAVVARLEEMGADASAAEARRFL